MIIKRRYLFIIITIIITCNTPALGSYVQHAFLQGWYPLDKNVLQKKLESMKKKSLIEYSSIIKNARMAIVPHAGLLYAGDLQAACFNCFNRKKVKRVLLMAPLHHAPMWNVVVPSYTHYQLPTGTIKVDQNVIKRLKRHRLFYTMAQTKTSKDPHTVEHTIEVLLPFVHYYFPTAMIVPLMVGTLHDKDIYSAAHILKKYIDDTTIVIVSADFTHYGSLYNCTSGKTVSDKKKYITACDNRLIRLIATSDPLLFLHDNKQHDATLCGKYPIALALSLVQQHAFDVSAPICIGKKQMHIKQKNIQSDVSYIGMVYNQRPAEKLVQK